MNNLFSIDNKIENIANNEKISLYAKIDNLNVQRAVNNTDFMNLTLIDDTGMINAKKWDINQEEKNLFKIGQLVFISGYGSEYNGKVQLIIEEMRLVDERDDIDLSIFYSSAPISVESLKDSIFKYVLQIKNDKLRAITNYLVKKYKEQYFIYPAATKNHHAYISGLAHHVLSMCQLAENIYKVYPNLNMDLLYAGIILHDIGKVIELSDHLAPEYTSAGKLIGHISLANEEIRVCSDELNIHGEEVMLLKHLILSHHGLLEYGSPKTPQVLEAEMLHLLDLMDSRMNMITDELEQVEESEYTKRVYTLNGRSFFKHNINNN